MLYRANRCYADVSWLTAKAGDPAIRGPYIVVRAEARTFCKRFG